MKVQYEKGHTDFWIEHLENLNILARFPHCNQNS